MLIIDKTSDLRAIVKKNRLENKKIGFVPTMGFLHEGHGSLIKKSSENNDLTIVSIFVNPIQFGPNEDLDSYPKDLENDKKIATKNGADIIFTPTVAEVYPEKLLTFVNVNDLDKELCGAKREGHFKGVCTVVTKLFNMVNPDNAYFGKKDAQQLSIIKKMVKDLNYDINIIGCEIIREEDGLAKSSRNSYLNSEERNASTILFKSLNLIQKELKKGVKDVKILKAVATELIEKEPLAIIDYIDIVDFKTLQKIDNVNDEILIAMAVFIGKTRLIDNLIYNPTKE